MGPGIACPLTRTSWRPRATSRPTKLSTGPAPPPLRSLLPSADTLPADAVALSWLGRCFAAWRSAAGAAPSSPSQADRRGARRSAQRALSKPRVASCTRGWQQRAYSASKVRVGAGGGRKWLLPPRWSAKLASAAGHSCSRRACKHAQQMPAHRTNPTKRCPTRQACMPCPPGPATSGAAAPAQARCWPAGHSARCWLAGQTMMARRPREGSPPAQQREAASGVCHWCAAWSSACYSM